jgi:hypothetical protein
VAPLAIYLFTILFIIDITHNLSSLMTSPSSTYS